eukprot:SAG11_NODE_19641_length_462_cov_0.853994_1_plen_73_part_00
MAEVSRETVASSIISRPALRGVPSASQGMQSAFKALDGPAEIPPITPPMAVQKSTQPYVGRKPLMSGKAQVR